MKEVHILGAGMVGISTAIWLQRAGFKVTIIDRIGIRDEARTVSTGGRRGVDAAIGVETTTCAKSSWKALLLTSFSRRRGVGFDGSRVRAIERVLSSPSKSGGTHRETVDVSACPTQLMSNPTPPGEIAPPSFPELISVATTPPMGKP